MISLTCQMVTTQFGMFYAYKYRVHTIVLQSQFEFRAIVIPNLVK